MCQFNQLIWTGHWIDWDFSNSLAKKVSFLFLLYKWKTSWLNQEIVEIFILNYLRLYIITQILPGKIFIKEAKK